ncbi:MAG TPA: hypothetical protein VMU08_17955 [Rhizomicrobium sp.]|nr:hypothetical protein [Rhizomicrobium sp.]
MSGEITNLPTPAKQPDPKPWIWPTLRRNLRAHAPGIVDDTGGVAVLPKPEIRMQFSAIYRESRT